MEAKLYIVSCQWSGFAGDETDEKLENLVSDTYERLGGGTFLLGNPQRDVQFLAQSQNEANDLKQLIESQLPNVEVDVEILEE